MSQGIHLVCPHCDALNRLPPERLGDGAKCGKCGTQLISGAPLELSEDRFDRFVQKSQLPVLVDFWASWCGPCKMMAPAFAQAAQILAPQVLLAKINTEQAQQLSARYGIRSIPSLLLFNQGQEVARMAGAMDTQSIVGWVRQQLG